MSLFNISLLFILCLPGYTQGTIDLTINANDIAKVMNDCKIHTANNDIANRNLASEILSGMDVSCLNKQKESMSLDSFMNDISNVSKHVDKNKIWNDTTLIALEKSVHALLSLNMRIANKTGIVTASQAKNIICSQVQKLCVAGRTESLVIEKSVENFLLNNKKNPILYLDSNKQEVLKKDFNQKIDAANYTCALTRKKYFEIKEKYSCNTFPKIQNINGKITMKPLRPMTPVECDSNLQIAYVKHKELEALAKESIDLNMKLLLSSELGPLFVTNNFRKSIGSLRPDFAFESCMKGTGNILNRSWHKSINEARSELYSLTVQELKKIENQRIKTPSFQNRDNELERYIKTNPLTISELLKRSLDPSYAKFICTYINSIHRSDKISNYIDNGLIGIGVISGIAFGFASGGSGLAVLTPAATALSAISIGSTAISITKNAVDYHELLLQDHDNRQSMASKQRKIDRGIQALEVSDQKKDALVSNMKWSAAGVVLEVVGLSFSIRRAEELIVELKSSPALYEMAEGVNQLAKSQSLYRGSQAFNKYVKTLNPTKLGPLKNLDIGIQTKLAAIFSKLDEVTGKLVVENLAKLSPKEFNIFLSLIEDASFANAPARIIMTALEDFSKTGVMKKIQVPLTPIELAKSGPKVPKDPNRIVVVYPESSRVISQVFPEAGPKDIKKIISEIRTVYRGMVKDNEIALIVERLSSRGIKTTADLNKRFEELFNLKKKHIELFLPEGVMNKPGLGSDGDLIKLAYLDELEKSGVPARNSMGDLILSPDQGIVRNDISKLSLNAKREAIKKEMSFFVNRLPCN